MMIEARELSKFYGTREAVRGVSFDVGEGETVGFLGANGAGKSTTMRMLTGFLAPTAGTARIAGFDVRSESLQARANLGYLPESTPLYGDMRVGEFLEYRSRLKGISRHARAAAIGEAMTKCRIDDMRDRLVGQLSKGYRQRVGLADCLLGRPKLLILDEPTVGLDPNQVVETRGLIREIGSDRTVFLSTHILHEVELICKRVIIIHGGRLIAQGTAAELCDRYSAGREVSLQLAAAPEAEEALSRVEGVRGVAAAGRTADGGAECYTLKCNSGKDPRRELARLAADKGWLLQEMRLEPVRLEDIFAKLTREAEADGKEGAA